ncbi:hypothetical protein AWJ20_244 [Sugiyamaella lignohabitans]|uniref:Uncharacterized protein n=1 Tax=Sugiyamaella lignohabitans TaxID=796027 RepID=A0A167CR97_9ASCO|nr:uncharacterized protein AWJ20_244 [Sugiyamaella lignohabitans]ANB12013.1 hypothetical protein AWJ20_244 [Sugiyamaella lignohabitans]
MLDLVLPAGIVIVLFYFIYNGLRHTIKPKIKSKQVETEEKPDDVCNLVPSPIGLTPEKLPFYNDRPWRPFRWPYHQTMSIRKLDINHWLDMDKWYVRYIKERKDILSKYKEKVFGYLPESEAASRELLETVVAHMLARYPKLFKLDTENPNRFHNLITGEVLDLKDEKLHPLEVAGRIAKEDFYIVQRRPDGRHYLTAMLVAFPGGFFANEENIGKHLDQIHTSVPYYQTKLQPSMERFFGKLKVNEPVERASFIIAYDKGLYTTKMHEHDPGNRYSHQSFDHVPHSKFGVRVERQALRRLPKTQAIIFTNHPIFYTFEEMKDEPMIPSILRNIIKDGPEKILPYKLYNVLEPYLGPYLESLIQRQIDMGIIKESDPVRTIPTYPFAHWIDTGPTEYGWTSPHQPDTAEPTAL